MGGHADKPWGWRPMDLAPRCGEVIFVWLHPDVAESKGKVAEFVRLHESPMLGEIWMAVDFDWSFQLEGAIAWMPTSSVPAPPADVSKSARSK